MNSYSNHASNIFVVYDSPWSSCDKKRLFENIKQINNKSEKSYIFPNYCFSYLRRHNLYGKIRLIYEIFKQVFYTLLKTKKMILIFAGMKKKG